MSGPNNAPVSSAPIIKTLPLPEEEGDMNINPPFY
jgi:hypothetical protein